jgi:hypothetical protein
MIDTLVVNGVYMDTITEVGAVLTYGCDWDELKENWKNLAVTCAWQFSSMAAEDSDGELTEAEPCYTTTESIPQAFFETLTFGRIDSNTGNQPEGLRKVELARIEAIDYRERIHVPGPGAG